MSRIRLAALQTYGIFMEGTKNFYVDTKDYIKIRRNLKASSGDFKKLIRREIELYDQMPKDMLKVTPTLILASLPVVFYFILPLLYFFPKQLLCSHFWTSDQKMRFSNDYLRQRLKHNKSLLKHLRRFQCSFPEQYPQSLIKEWLKILDSLRGGNQPDVQQILDCKLMFGPGPYCLLCLEGDHLKKIIMLNDRH
ncbi:LETM1 domain-containing protein 1-like isoform X3 [Cylas formicarius]|uniref:LETM1 domain-containing protein 1-like isoform X3 n=1 Tax=Cylas formicarius TaxID=197179 RepID=UPI0029589497|nr:LETM1 domain-containing protein 1-like isoform X3 [Cylas formicarius]